MACRDGREVVSPRHVHAGKASPQDSCVLLMQANGVLDDHWTSLRVIHDAIKVLDVAKAVAAQGQGVGTEAEALRGGKKGH